MESEAKDLSIFQSYSWAKVLNSIGAKPTFFMAMEGRDPLLGLLMFKSRLVSGLFSGYEAKRGPLIVPQINTDVLPFFVSALKDILKRKSTLYFYWEAPLHPTIEPYLRNQGFFPIPAATFMVDLSLSLDSLWAKLEKRARWGVKKAQKMDVLVYEARSWKDWRTYYDIYVRGSYQKRVRPLSLALHKSFYTSLLPEGKVRLFIAKYRGKIIAGALFLVSRDEMIYYEGASRRKYTSLQPNNIIQWHAISWAKQQQIKRYDLGGALWKPERRSFLYGVHVFKRGWGGELVRFNSFAVNKFFVFGRNLFFGSSKIRQLYYTLERLKMVQRSDRLSSA